MDRFYTLFSDSIHGFALHQLSDTNPDQCSVRPFNGGDLQPPDKSEDEQDRKNTQDRNLISYWIIRLRGNDRPQRQAIRE